MKGKLRQFDNEKLEEVESEIENFDADYLYPALPFKGPKR